MGARLGDEFGRTSSTRPKKLATILRLAGDARYVVELGTAHAWTAISLALADPDRQVASYDPFERREAHKYLGLVPESTRRRVSLVIASGQEGPKTDTPVDLLYIDTSHEQTDTIREFEAWRPVLSDGAAVVLDDYSHPEFPGVTQAVRVLGLDGEERDGLFVHRVRRG